MSQLLVKERRVVLKEKNQIGDKGSIIAGFTRWIWGGGAGVGAKGPSGARR